MLLIVYILSLAFNTIKNAANKLAFTKQIVTFAKRKEEDGYSN